MSRILTMGKNLERTLGNVELVLHTDEKVSFKFEVGDSTSEKYIRETGFGEGQDGNYYMYLNDDETDNAEDTIEFYGYTKIDKVTFEKVDDTRYCTITLRKPTLNELISDVYKELTILSNAQTALTMDVGGTFVDMAQDNIKMMMAQLGGN